MKLSRRDLAVLLSALAADAAGEQAAKGATGHQAPAAEEPHKKSFPTLESKTYDFNSLHEVMADKDGTRKFREVCHGISSRGQEIEIHMSELEPGHAPHPPHKHPEEEIIFLREGMLEIEINGHDGEFGYGQTSTVGPGSVSYWASNQVHGVRSVGKTWAKYFDIMLGPFS